MKTIELIDKYEVHQSEEGDYNPPNYIWVDNTGELIRCKDCKYSVEEYNDGECYCDYNRELRYIKDWDHYCGWAERKEE